MKNVKRSTSRLAFTGFAAATAAVLAGTGVASAVGTWPANYVDAESVNAQNTGGIILYGLDGVTPITSGATNVSLSQVISKAVSVGTAPAQYTGDTSGFNGTEFEVATPVASADGATWNSVPSSADPTTMPNASTQPYYVPETTDDSINSLIASAGTEANGFYELRLHLLDGTVGFENHWYTLEIQVSGNTFTVLDPATVSTNPSLPEVPMSAVLPIVGFAVAGGTMVLRRRRKAASVIA